MARSITNQDIQAELSKRFAEERRRDAEELARYQRECAASWQGRETNVQLA